MSRYIVGAYNNGVFVRWASGEYGTREAAEAYRDACVEKCSAATKMTYEVVKVER